jgi:hypothetical protein
VGVSHFDVSWESLATNDYGIILAETDEVVKTTIKISTSSALRKRLFHFFILFVDVDT